MAIQIDKYDTINDQYEYWLRHNITNPDDIDHFDERDDLKIPFKVFDFKGSR